MRLDFTTEDEETVFTIIEEQVKDHIETTNLKKMVDAAIKASLRENVEKAVRGYLGIRDRGWGEIEIKYDSPLAKMISEKVDPLARKMVDEVVGDRLDPDEKWLEAIVTEVKEQAESEVRSYISGRVFSGRGLDNDVRGPVNDVVADAARSVAMKAIKEALGNGDNL